MKKLIVKFSSSKEEAWDQSARGELLMRWFGTLNIIAPVALDENTFEVTWCNPSQITGYEEPFFVVPANNDHPLDRINKINKHFKGENEIQYIYELDVSPNRVDMLNIIFWTGIGFFIATIMSMYIYS